VRDDRPIFFSRGFSRDEVLEGLLRGMLHSISSPLPVEGSMLSL